MESIPTPESKNPQGLTLSKVAKDPVGYARAALIITIAVKRVFEKGLAELKEQKKDGLPTTP